MILSFIVFFESLFQGMFSKSALCFMVCARKSGCRMRYCRVSRKTCSPWDITARIVASNMATFAWNFSISSVEEGHLEVERKSELGFGN